MSDAAFSHPQRGRPRKIDSPAEAVPESAQIEATEQRQAPDAPVTRETRKPFGSQAQKLAYAQRPGYHRRWFNDVPGRIVDAQEAGFALVVGEDKKNVSRPVGVNEAGGALIAYLMEIPQDWYDEDMAREQAKVDEVDRAIRRGGIEGEPGKDGRYVPQTGIKIGSNRR